MTNITYACFQQHHVHYNIHSSGSRPGSNCNTLIRITSWINTLIRFIVLDQLTHQDNRPGSTYSSGSSPWINLLIRFIALDQLTHQDHRPGYKLFILDLHTSVTTLTISCSMAYFLLQNIIPRHNIIIQDKQQITHIWMSFTTV